MPTIDVQRIEHSRTHKARIDAYPDKCPFCEQFVKPVLFKAFGYGDEDEGFMAIFLCPNRACSVPLLAFYNAPSNRYVSPYTLDFADRFTTFVRPTQRSEHIKTVSPRFGRIYDQAQVAEANGLDEVCGPGYRRALEFLVKDFIIAHELQKGDKKAEETVLTLQLSQCIERYISDDRIKRAAKLAAWLGNDETHYVRKWADKEIKDLKALIEMTVHWIDLVMASDKYAAEMMPDSTAKAGDVADPN